jgi:predicted lipid carrier protein YhbT
MDFADFRFPSVFSQMGKMLPAPVSSLPLITALDFARRRQWLIAPDYLNGKTFLIHIVDMGLQIQFACVNGRFKPTSQRVAAEQIDVRLSANAVDYFQMASGMADADTLFFQRKLKIEGDTELGVAVKYWLDASERPAWLVSLATRLGQ